MTNTFIPKFTYVIPFKFEQDRIIPLKRVIEILSGFQGIEIMLVEQDTHTKISHLNLKVNHIFLKSDAPFNKAWAYNVALRRAISPVMIFADADFFMNPNDLIESLKILENCDCVIPTKKVVKLNPQQSMAEVGNIFSFAASAVEKSNLTDGIVLFKRQALLDICGWNEDFFGLGYTNEFEDLKIRAFTKWEQLDFVGYHFYHLPEQIEPNLNTRNLQIWEHFRDGNKEKLNHQMQSSASRIGYQNKIAQY